MKCIYKCLLWNGSHLVSASICWLLRIFWPINFLLQWQYRIFTYPPQRFVEFSVSLYQFREFDWPFMTSISVNWLLLRPFAPVPWERIPQYTFLTLSHRTTPRKGHRGMSQAICYWQRYPSQRGFNFIRDSIYSISRLLECAMMDRVPYKHNELFRIGNVIRLYQ